jgi:LAS superfamily LD-carboxypeptidase LdcB
MPPFPSVRFRAPSVSAILVIAIAFSASCGGGSKPKSASPTVAGATVARAPAAPPRGQTSPVRGPFSTPSESVTAPFATPTVAATCAPADLLRLVDKQAALPPEYEPPDLVQLQPIDASPNVAEMLRLRHEAEDALHKLLDAGRNARLFLLAQSTYRSYGDQERVYQSEVEHFGQGQADRESARPGHSEHQLGTAIDFTTRALGYDLVEAFAGTPEGKWLQQNAAQYGFVLSYPQEKEADTGYMYEPWHYRYIGVQAAQAEAQSGLTLNKWLEQRQVGCQP